MKVILRKIVSLLVVAFISFQALAIPQPPPDNLLQTLNQQLSKFKQVRRQDKIYLHLDKPYYTAGDTIWFKAWQVASSTHQPHSKSQVLYAEVIAPNGRLLTERKVRIADGQGAGDFNLPDTLSSGLYQVRAYTNWMRNFDESFFFTQNIPVYNPAQPVQAFRQPVNRAGIPVAGLNFFPESGKLLAGLPVRVAVQATDNEGRPAAIKGNIQDEAGVAVAQFETRQNGIGSFTFTPRSGQSYVAVTNTISSLPKAKIALPTVKDQGFSLTVATNPDKSYRVTVASVLGTSAGSNLLLIAQAQDSIYYASRLNLQNQQATVSVPESTFPAGVVQWVLFSPEGNPLAERLIFSPGPALQVKITSDKQTYAPREKVTLKVSVTDQQGKPVSTSLALAVSDADQFPDPGTINQNLRSYLLMGADLTLPVTDPDYYFRQNTPTGALDELMLTQNWRRFSWAQLAQGQMPTVPFDAEEGIRLQGRLTDASGNSLLNNIVMASVLDEERAFRKDFTEEDGSFDLGTFDFNNTIEVIFQQYQSSRISNGKIHLDTTQLPTASRTTVFKPLGGETFTRYLEKSNMRWRIAEAWGEYAPDTLNQVQVTSGIGLPTAKRAAISDYTPDETILVENFISFSSVPELLKELVPGIRVSQRKGNWQFRVLNRSTKLYYKGEPLYIIDKIPVYNKDIIVNQDPADIYSIELISQPFKLSSFGQLGFNGVIIINTKNNGFYPDEISNVTKLKISGYNLPRPFYLPVYNAPKMPTELPDLRPLIYWNPHVQTDVTGQVTLTFYNSDDVAPFRVYTEGVTKEGKVALGSYIYKVVMPEKP